MSQITLYLDDEVQALIEQRAKASGLSKSRWVAQLITRHAVDEWPQACLELAGRFVDFPLTESAPAQPPDVARLVF